MRIYITLFLVVVTTAIHAQTLTGGNYTSSDGNYTVSIRHNNNSITLTSPVKVEEYRSNGTGNRYFHTDPKYTAYYIRVAGSNQFYTGKSGGQEHSFTFSGEGSSNDGAIASGIDNCPLYDKYLNMAQTDGNDAQAWAFCGAAALARCTYNADGLQEYLKPLITALKSIQEDNAACPCNDVITAAEWNSVSLD